MSFPINGTAHVIVDQLDDAITIAGDEGHHLSRVRRLRAGEVVTAADGAGAWRAYSVEVVVPGSVGLRATCGVEIEPVLVPGLAVAFCLTKGDKPEMVVEKLTELGADRILPVVSARSVVRWDERKAAAAHGRWRVAVRAAAQQSRRARLPALAAVTPLAALAGHAAVVVADPAGGDDAGTVVADPPGGEVLLIVGPEGGFDPGEIEALGPWRRLGLAPSILRAETAAVAGAGAICAARWARSRGSFGR